MNNTGFHVGQTVSCCGGDKGVILAITDNRVLLTIAVPDYKMIKMVVGSCPHAYDNELVWDFGHYYHADGRDSSGIGDAWKDWNEKH